MTRILLIDDDQELCEMLAEFLATEGFEVGMAHDGNAGAARAREDGWDAIVLDVMMPGMNGFDVLRQLRPEVTTPVLMLTARGEDLDTVVGLELGADDYVAKPANPRVLAARLRALLRRSGGDEADGPLRVGDLTLDSASRRVTVNGAAVELTGAEFSLLELLVRSAGHVVSKEVLAEEGLGRALQAFDRRVDTHVSQLRRKLGSLPDGDTRIRNVRGSGYQYVVS